MTEIRNSGHWIVGVMKSRLIGTRIATFATLPSLANKTK